MTVFPASELRQSNVAGSSQSRQQPFISESTNTSALSHFICLVPTKKRPWYFFWYSHVTRKPTILPQHHTTTARERDLLYKLEDEAFVFCSALLEQREGRRSGSGALRQHLLLSGLITGRKPLTGCKAVAGAGLVIVQCLTRERSRRVSTELCHCKQLINEREMLGRVVYKIGRKK